MSSLEERLDSFPEAWRPTAPGEKLVGELTDVDLRESEYGEPYPILTVRSEADGTEYAWHAFHAMARHEVAKKKPQVGERVGILYAGLGEAQPGMNPPKRWRLLVDRPKRQLSFEVENAAPEEIERLAEVARTAIAEHEASTRAANGEDDGIPF